MKLHFKSVRSVVCLATFITLQTIISTTTAVTLTYPSAGCNVGLQACINAAAPGDTVQVATNAPIGEDLTIDKSLTLRPAPGFSPELNDFASVSLFNMGRSSNSIVFEGFRLNPGFVQAVQLSSQPFDVKIRNITVTDTYNDREAIEVRTGLYDSYGPVTFDISNNDIRIPDAYFSITAIAVNGVNASTFQGSIHNNRIEDLAGNEGAAIGVYNYVSDLDVDVIGNEITGSNFNNGIIFDQFSNGTSNLRVINNLVDGQVSVAGHVGAVAIGISEGDATFLVANNTVVNSDHGISISGRDDLGATWSGVVANNVVADINNWGVNINDPLGTVTNEHNIIYDVAGNFFTPGLGTLFLDPQFVGGGDYRLGPGSPARDAGNNGLVQIDITTDLVGMPRIRGNAVDMGAYETVPEPSSLMLLVASLAFAVGARSSRRTEID
jgi:hypothetical protein